MPLSVPGAHAPTTRSQGGEQNSMTAMKTGGAEARDLAPPNAAMSHTEKDPAICPTDDDTILPKRIHPKVDKQSREYIIKSGIAGGLAGCAAKTVVGPLDRVKILFQASSPKFAKYTGSWFGVVEAMRHIYSRTGTRGLFKGHSATLLRIFPYAGIKFLAYEQVRNVMIKDKSQETVGRRFFSGSIAGLLSVFFTYPLEVIRVRMAFNTNHETKATFLAICKLIYNEKAGGPSHYPVKLTALPESAAPVVESAAAAVQKVAPRSGLSNFYRGFTPTLWGMLPYAGASFLTHDYAKDFLRQPYLAEYTTVPATARPTESNGKPAQLKYWAQLSAGGLAGFVSQTISYPLEVIRRRMQVGGAVGDGHRLGMLEVANKIWLERGWRGFYIGLSIGYVKVIPMTATSFFVYERAKYHFGI